LGIARVDCCTVSTDLQMLVASKVGTFIPNLGMIGLQVLKLFAMYATDGHTDGQTDKRTDGRTDGQKTKLTAPSLRAGPQWHTVIRTSSKKDPYPDL